MAYDYLPERYQLARLLDGPVRITEDPQHWGAKRIEVPVVQDRLLIRVTDTQDVSGGRLLRLLSGWEYAKRQQFADLHWCVEVFDLANGDRLAGQQAVDTSMTELRECVKLALQYALNELEPQLCPMT